MSLILDKVSDLKGSNISEMSSVFNEIDKDMDKLKSLFMLTQLDKAKNS